jgi:hypothetical protein
MLSKRRDRIEEALDDDNADVHNIYEVIPE